MLDTYYFKDKKQAKENLNKNLKELKEWYQLELDKYITADTNFDQWFTEYTGQSFDEMLKEQEKDQALDPNNKYVLKDGKIEIVYGDKTKDSNE